MKRKRDRRDAARERGSVPSMGTKGYNKGDKERRIRKGGGGCGAGVSRIDQKKGESIRWSCTLFLRDNTANAGDQFPFPNCRHFDGNLQVRRNILAAIPLSRYCWTRHSRSTRTERAMKDFFQLVLKLLLLLITFYFPQGDYSRTLSLIRNRIFRRSRDISSLLIKLNASRTV